MRKGLLILKRTLLTAVAVLAVFFVLIFGGLAWVYNYPAQAWQIAQSRFLPEDLKVTWEDINLHVQRTQGWNFEVNFSMDQLSVKKTSPFLDVRIDRFSLVSYATLFFPRTNLRLQELIVRSDSPIIVRTTPSAESAKPFDPSQTLQQIKSIIAKAAQWQSRIDIGRVDIDLSEIQYSSGPANPIRISFEVQNRIENGNRLDFTVAVLDLSDLLDRLNVRGSGDLSLFGTESSFLDVTAVLGGKGMKANIPMTVTFQGERLKLNSKFDFSYLIKDKWLSVGPDLVLQITPNNLDLKLVSDVSGIPGPLPKIKNVRISYQLPFAGGWMEAKGHLSVAAPIPLFFLNDQLRKNVIASCRCTIVSSVMTKIEADLWLDRLVSSTEEPRSALEADLRAESVSNSIFAIDLGGTLKMMNTTAGWKFEPTLDTSARIKNFKAAREILKAMKIMVPAPLSVLDGTIDFHAQSPVEFENIEGQPSAISAKASLAVDLKSSNQTVKASTQLLMTSNSDFKAMNIDVDALIDDLIVELPPLDPVKGLPKLVLDSRIQMKPKEPKKQASSFKLTFGFRLKTTKPAAIKLLYPLADPYIPITINYGRGNTGEGGYLQIEPFAINYLKRTVHVDSLRLNLDQIAGTDFPIDGKFHVQQTEYKVFIRVSGTTRRPNIDFSSEPYLERADIISVLLFDRISDRLVGGDSETAGNAQAAVADKAIGLFGLWAFAATPIRSFSYNAVTKVYSATIVLGDGLTAGVGTSLDEYTSFEIRKRLSQNWVIATSWAPSDSSDETRKVVLQWEKRY